MPTKTFFSLAFFLLLAACHADPNVISDDDNNPTGPDIPLECDSLPVPNSVFSNKIGEILIFEDSLRQYIDSIVCVKNEAKEVESDLFGEKYCQHQYATAYSTNWLTAPDIYFIEFENNSLPHYSSLSAYSIPLEDFSAFDQRFTEVAGMYENSVTINGKSFHHVFSYNCNSSAPCTFAESFVFSLNEGLVAIKRQGVWWTEK